MQSGAEELDELADDALLAQHLGHGQHQIGCGRAFAQLVLQPDADDLRDQHGDRLAQHGRLGFDSADAPAQHAQAVDHRGVRVGADQRVGIGQRLAGLPFAPTKTTRARYSRLIWWTMPVSGRHDGEVLEGRLSPAQEGIALFVALELQLGIELEGLRRAELIHLHRVIDHQLGRLQRIDQLGIAAQRLHGIAHGGQIDHRGHAGEILQQHAAGHEGDLLRRDRSCRPRGQRANVVGLHGFAVFAAQQVLQQDAQRKRQVADGATVLLERIEPVDFKFVVADRRMERLPKLFMR